MNPGIRPLLFGGVLYLSTLGPSVWALPFALGISDWFSLSSSQSSLAPAPLVDFTAGSSGFTGRTVTSVERYISDPYARPNTPEFSVLSNWLSVAPIGNVSFSSEYSRASLGAGTASGFGRLGWGDGLNTVGITSAFGDIVTVLPGGSLNVNLTFGGFSARTTERVTPTAAFDLDADEQLEAAKTIVHMGGTCQQILGPIVECTGKPFAFGVEATPVLTLGVWDIHSVAQSPFSRFGTGTGVDCAGAVICQTFSFHDGVGTPLVDGTDVGDARFSYIDTGGFFGATIPSSLSTGGGGTYYLGAQLSISLAPEVSEWGTLAGCLEGPWGQAPVGQADELCRPKYIEPALAFDMSHSLNVVFSGDAQYESQSGIFLSGQDVPEPSSLALVAVALAGLSFGRRRKY